MVDRKPKNQGQEKGQYNSIRYTPPAIARLMVQAIPDNNFSHDISEIVDVGAGSTGVWGLAMQERWPEATLIGVECRPIMPPLGFDRWYNTDFMFPNPHYCPLGKRELFLRGCSFYVTNPPYDQAESFFWQIKNGAGTNTRLFMFVGAGWLEGKDRRRRIYDVIPPNLIIHLDGRLIDKSVPGTSGGDKRGRVGLYWDFGHLVRPGNTRIKWVGSDNIEDYRVIYLPE